VGTLGLVNPLVATVLGITVAGEVFGPTQALGVGAVLLGVLLGQPAVVDAVVRVLPGRRGRSG
jgi:probable blue pigment (indigoidine) exporter